MSKYRWLIGIFALSLTIGLAGCTSKKEGAVGTSGSATMGHSGNAGAAGEGIKVTPVTNTEGVGAAKPTPTP